MHCACEGVRRYFLLIYRSVLQKTNEALSVKDEGGEKGEGHSSKHSHEHHFSVNTENISVCVGIMC